MQTTIAMGYQAVEGGGFRAAISWQIDDNPKITKVSPEVYATPEDAMGAAEYMARVLTRIVAAAGYEETEVYDVSAN